MKTEIAHDLIGKRGYPRYPATLGIDPPMRIVGDAGAEIVPAPAPGDLATLKVSLMARIDIAAEAARARYITPGSGQAMTYQAKAAEAERLAVDPTPDADAYPMLAAEVGVTAGTLAEVGAVVRAAHAQWQIMGGAIERARLAGKAAVMAAEVRPGQWRRLRWSGREMRTMNDDISADAPAGFAKEQLRSFVERIERLEEEKKAIADDIKDVFAEAKGNGFDVAALRHILKLRKEDEDARKELDALVELYAQALGICL